MRLEDLDEREMENLSAHSWLIVLGALLLGCLTVCGLLIYAASFGLGVTD
jgi:hypothetical protein